MKQLGSFALSVIIAAAVIAGATAAASAGESAPRQSNPIRPSVSLPLQEARIIIDAASAYARSLKLRMAVVVLDDGGHLVSADCMDGTSFNSEHQAQGKAFTSIFPGSRVPRSPNS